MECLEALLTCCLAKHCWHWLRLTNTSLWLKWKRIDSSEQQSRLYGLRLASLSDINHRKTEWKELNGKAAEEKLSGAAGSFCDDVNKRRVSSQGWDIQRVKKCFWALKVPQCGGDNIINLSDVRGIDRAEAAKSWETKWWREAAEMCKNCANGS